MPQRAYTRPDGTLTACTPSSGIVLYPRCCSSQRCAAAASRCRCSDGFVTPRRVQDHEASPRTAFLGSNTTSAAATAIAASNALPPLLHVTVDEAATGCAEATMPRVRRLPAAAGARGFGRVRLQEPSLFHRCWAWKSLAWPSVSVLQASFAFGARVSDGPRYFEARAAVRAYGYDVLDKGAAVERGGGGGGELSMGSSCR